MEFGFPGYSASDPVFQSYVEGLDQGWSEPLESPRFQFTRIPSGEYRIRIRASNAWNRYSRESEIHLVVSRPWYLSTASAVLYGLLLIALVLVSRSIMVRRIRIREREIRESKEWELIRLRNEKLQAELTHQSKELANATMAMIKKNEFLMELKENLKRQKEELGTRYPDKYHYGLIRKIDRNISSMDDWKVFEFHFEQAHEKFLQRLRNRYPQLSQSDLRLCAYLRMNLSSKEIAPLLRISFRGVENHRYRLRKKFSLKKEANLTEFILSL
jgi:DNA-binding CsgD family transcriptional regulator